MNRSGIKRRLERKAKKAQIHTKRCITQYAHCYGKSKFRDLNYNVNAIKETSQDKLVILVQIMLLDK